MNDHRIWPQVHPWDITPCPHGLSPDYEAMPIDWADADFMPLDELPCTQ